ncbi:MAG: nucleotidyltransferase domain-containing protein [Deltaproteobacteria bacterium]|nr:nucleotidyltransferase domain-containing protein [Deltaproteobacteria bacterium]
MRLGVLFGSLARGTSHAGSDIDLAVIARGVDLLDLGRRVSSELGCDVDVVSADSDHIPLLDALVRDGIVVFESHRGAGAQWRANAIASLEIDRPWFAHMRDAYLRRVARRGVLHG